mmetsp:Transcript_5767/g.21807  ORF Transcript_5767/g.21807 Transcript_5767/m.21807 type:complete len:1437 (-) Transcript_5767:153-4463(-)|eukprot:CAMPEP_0117435084 /NCGR_PEP_ID=MMETSP0759-20121206/291_1 /TAXON_ID=63605 /ORGANISM="Percolomonas cosmopolitus, Strain WS" /LENGTH=1436 /DNA_ID=CAMNT_0005226605 /DNA_START=4461 /DNA_END=8771 /DNA_ORIENTATION=+
MESLFQSRTNSSINGGGGGGGGDGDGAAGNEEEMRPLLMVGSAAQHGAPEQRNGDFSHQHIFDETLATNNVHLDSDSPSQSDSSISLTVDANNETLLNKSSNKSSIHKLKYNHQLFGRIAKLISIFVFRQKPYITIPLHALILMPLLFILASSKAYTIQFEATYYGLITEYMIEKDFHQAFRVMLIVVVYAFGFGVLEGCILVLEQGLACLWRYQLTTYLMNLYFSGVNYFHVLFGSFPTASQTTAAEPSATDVYVDNVDQRLVEDLNTFCNEFAMCVVRFIVRFTMVVYGISLMIQHNYGVLVYTCFAFWSVCHLCCYIYILPPISSGVVLQDHLEGDFRFSHARVREHAESMAFFRGERVERRFIDLSFSRVLRNMRTLATRFIPYHFYTKVAQWSPYISIMLSLSVRVFTHGPPFDEDLSPGEISSLLVAAIFVTTQPIYMMTQIYFLFGEHFTHVASSAQRVCELLELLESLEKKKSADGSSPMSLADSPSSDDDENSLLQPAHRVTPQSRFIFVEDCVEFERFNCFTPSGELLVKDLNLRVEVGQSIMITGPSGCGKSSIFRVLGGLWPIHSGLIFKPRRLGREGIFFMPQKLYLVLGTLKDQLVYPDDLSKKEVPTPSDEELRQLLVMVNLEYLLDRFGLDTEHSWKDLLSPGEQQRLGMARVLYHKPKYAILDECTSACDPENERIIYEHCVNLGITLVSIAHRKELKRYHSRILKLYGNGTGMWSVDEVPEHAQYQRVSHSYHGGATSHPRTESRVASTRDLFSYDVIDEGQSPLFTGGETSSQHQKTNTVKQKQKRIPKAGINLAFIRRFIRLLKLSARNSYPKLLLTSAALIFISFIFQFIRPISSIFDGWAFAAVTKHNLSWFIIGQSLYFLSSLYLAVGSSVSFFIYGLLGIKMRRNITTHIHKRYFSNLLYHKLIQLDNRVDNADSRITREVDQFTNGFGSDAPNEENGTGIPILTGYFLDNLVGFFVIFARTWMVSGFVGVVSSFLFFILIVLVQIPLVSMVSTSTFKLNAREGDFRFALIRLREYGEQIAFYQGSERELHLVKKRFANVIRTKIILGIRMGLLKGFLQMQTILSTMVIYLAILFSYFFGLIEQSGNIGGILTELRDQNLPSNLSKFLSLGFRLAPNAGACSRVGHMLDVMSHLEAKYPRSVSGIRHNFHYEASRESVEFAGVTCITPTGKVLARDLRFNVLWQRGNEHKLSLTNSVVSFPSSGLLVCGPSGCGKTSILRLIGALWPLGAEEYAPNIDARIRRPFNVGHNGMFFLSQKAYMLPQGSLKEQIMYPKSLNDGFLSDLEARTLLDKVNLSYLLKRFDLNEPLDESKNWASILSGGEQQRLSVCRVLYHRAKFCVCDESTSALDTENEKLMYETMCHAKDESICVVSVGHRDSLRQFHEFVLELDKVGGWKLLRLRRDSLFYHNAK